MPEQLLVFVCACDAMVAISRPSLFECCIFLSDMCDKHKDRTVECVCDHRPGHFQNIKVACVSNFLRGTMYGKF